MSSCFQWKAWSSFLSAESEIGTHAQLAALLEKQLERL
jgi:hypothetical protein